MRLTERYRPASLAGVVGQFCVRKLQRFAAEPYSTCWLFQGQPGIGKSAAAHALAADLGADERQGSLRVVEAGRLGVDEAKQIVDSLRLYPWTGKWNVVILEEVETLSPQCQAYLKAALESARLPKLAIVIATSNDTSRIAKALLQRFVVERFDSYVDLPAAGAKRIAEIWSAEVPGLVLPYNARHWGWEYDDKRKPVAYSLRAALDCLQQALLELPESTVAA